MIMIIMRHTESTDSEVTRVYADSHCLSKPLRRGSCRGRRRP